MKHAKPKKANAFQRFVDNIIHPAGGTKVFIESPVYQSMTRECEYMGLSQERYNTVLNGNFKVIPEDSTQYTFYILTGKDKKCWRFANCNRVTKKIADRRAKRQEYYPIRLEAQALESETVRLEILDKKWTEYLQGKNIKDFHIKDLSEIESLVPNLEIET